MVPGFTNCPPLGDHGAVTYPLVDHALSLRLERAEGAANCRFVETRAALDPGSAACWLDADGTWAMFDGVGSPLTQTFGLGMSSAASAETLAMNIVGDNGTEDKKCLELSLHLFIRD
jgi:hypothetical protein